MQSDINNVKLIVGLGNVGDEYARTRHNAGFIFIDELRNRLLPQLNWSSEKDFKADVIKTPGNEFVLLKPTTMMNNSGEAVREVMDYFKLTPEEILVAYDDMDIELGGFKLQFNSGPKVHNGITSVRNRLGTNSFWHMRLGIENREVKGNKGIPGLTYALQRFKTQEYEEFISSCNAAIDQLQEG